MKFPLLYTLSLTVLLTGHALAADAPDPMTKADIEMTAVLKAHAELKPKPIETLSPTDARIQPTLGDAAKQVMEKQGKDAGDPLGVRTRSVSFKGPDGEIQARIYTPDGAEDKALPVVLYFHGGGWVIANISTYDTSARAIANQANVIVVSSHYRQAPEHKFPAAHDDAFAAYKWVLENAASFGGDPKRIAVAGESAGGNLAINTAIAARDANIQLPVYEVLVYPVAGVDMNTASYQQNANAKPLNQPTMAWFMEHVLKSDDDKQDPRLDLVGKADLKGLPPTTVILAEIDPLRSEGQALVDKLKAAGVKVNAKTYDGVTHEFFGMGEVVSDAKDAQSVVAKDLKAAFGQ